MDKEHLSMIMITKIFVALDKGKQAFLAPVIVAQSLEHSK